MVTPCHYCGKPAVRPVEQAGNVYCCRGCLRLKEMEAAQPEAESCAVPDWEAAADSAENVRWAHLKDPAYRDRMVRTGSDGRAAATLFIPDMVCASCVAFLEKLPAKNEAIARAEVNFPRKELRVAFDESRLSLDALAAFLDRLGYPPEMRNAADSSEVKKDRTHVARLAVAGFCFGNIMLISFADHLGGEAFDLSGFQAAFGWFNFALSLPVLLFSARGYFESAWKALRAGGLNMDVPIALGMVVIFVRSVGELLLDTGMGYFDSLAGLAFFLLIGKWYQHSTHSKLAHERDYQSWFPISVLRLTASGEAEAVPISSLVAGDRIRIHHGEIVPADGNLLSGAGQIDRSFITGESHPVAVRPGQSIEAGGRQLGGAIELQVVRPVQQSALTRLWNSDAFQKDRKGSIQDPVDRISRHFTFAVLTIAIATLLFWIGKDASIAWNAFTATLIVACPCALALSLPFTYGSTLRWLGRAGAYLKNTLVVEQMARVRDLVFDKTGTLTAASAFETQFQALPGTSVPPSVRGQVAAAAGSSAHPLSRAIVRLWAEPRPAVQAFDEEPGSGVAARIDGAVVTLGTASWAGASPADIAALDGAFTPTDAGLRTTFSYVSIDGTLLGRFAFTKPLRDGIDAELTALAASHRLHLISGDSDAERSAFAPWFPADRMRFNMRPDDKMAYIRSVQAAHPGELTAMIGDGLNDAGALKEADLGVAVVDDLYAFSPASDLILDAKALKHWGAMLDFTRQAQRTVYLLFAISFAYNLVGLYFAVQGLLTPVVAAILMPVSSFTVVSVALGRTRWAWSRSGIRA